jgi:hypothetical protein
MALAWESGWEAPRQAAVILAWEVATPVLGRVTRAVTYLAAAGAEMADSVVTLAVMQEMEGETPVVAVAMAVAVAAVAVGANNASLYL